MIAPSAVNNRAQKGFEVASAPSGRWLWRKMRTAQVKKVPDWQSRLYHGAMADIPIHLDRAGSTSMATQI
jgi:hypothetical protein